MDGELAWNVEIEELASRTIWIRRVLWKTFATEEVVYEVVVAFASKSTTFRTGIAEAAIHVGEATSILSYKFKMVTNLMRRSIPNTVAGGSE